MKAILNLNILVTLLFISLFISCQKISDLDPIPNHSYTNLARIDADDSNHIDAAFRKIRRTPYTFEIAHQSKTSLQGWKGIYILPDGYEFTYNKLVRAPNAELFLIGGLTDKNTSQKHIAIIKFDYNGEMVWNTLLETAEYHKIEYAIEDSGDLYFISAKENLGNSKFLITRVESSGEFGFSIQFMHSRESSHVQNLSKMNNQLIIEIENDLHLFNTCINKKDGAICDLNLTQNTPVFIVQEDLQIQFIQRSIPIRRLLEGKYPPISQTQTHMASLN